MPPGGPLTPPRPPNKHEHMLLSLKKDQNPKTRLLKSPRIFELFRYAFFFYHHFVSWLSKIEIVRFACQSSEWQARNCPKAMEENTTLSAWRGYTKGFMLVWYVFNVDPHSSNSWISDPKVSFAKSFIVKTRSQMFYSPTTPPSFSTRCPNGHAGILRIHLPDNRTPFHPILSKPASFKSNFFLLHAKLKEKRNKIWHKKRRDIYAPSPSQKSGVSLFSFFVVLLPPWSLTPARRLLPTRRASSRTDRSTAPTPARPPPRPLFQNTRLYQTQWLCGDHCLSGLDRIGWMDWINSQTLGPFCVW